MIGTGVFPRSCDLEVLSPISSIRATSKSVWIFTQCADILLLFLIILDDDARKDKRGQDVSGKVDGNQDPVRDTEEKNRNASFLDWLARTEKGESDFYRNQ